MGNGADEHISHFRDIPTGLLADVVGDRKLMKKYPPAMVGGESYAVHWVVVGWVMITNSLPPGTQFGDKIFVQDIRFLFWVAVLVIIALKEHKE